MRIAVCIKQVPDTTDLSIDPQTNTLMREGVAAILNPLDEFPLEAALRLAEATGGSVTAFTMGPPAASDVIHTAMAMGVDDGVLVCDTAFAGADTWATSLTLAKAIAKGGPFDLVLCGKQAIDGDTAQVGPGIAAHLGLPQVTDVIGLETARPEAGKLMVERLLDEATVHLQVTLPAVLTILKDCNEPRLPTLAGRLNAYEKTIARWGKDQIGLAADAVGLDGSPTRVVKIATPDLCRENRRLSGNPEEIAEQLLRSLEVSR